MAQSTSTPLEENETAVLPPIRLNVSVWAGAAPVVVVAAIVDVEVVDVEVDVEVVEVGPVVEDPDDEAVVGLEESDADVVLGDCVVGTVGDVVAPPASVEVGPD